MKEEIHALLDKAGRSFDATARLVEDGDPDFAASRAYYGYFYVAEGLLLSEGLRFSRHAQVIGQYGSRFARTGVLDRRFHRLLTEAFDLRQAADYDARADLNAGEVRRLIDGGKEFLEAAREHLKDGGEDRER